jgi:photosystem II stability/assembly factor-like uncharacterized protein
MRTAALLAGLAAAAGDGPRSPFVVVTQDARATAHLQAVSVVDDRTVWVSGRGGTYARTTDGGATWTAAVVPGAEAREFRDVHAVDGRTAYLLSAGPGDASAVFKTTDGGASWRRVLANPDPAGFFDCFAFWDAETGLLYGDSVDGRPTLFVTRDGGGRWDRPAPPATPAALAGEGGFAASGTCVTTGPGGRAWVATGAGPTARVLVTDDAGRTFRAADAPVVAGDMAGITSVVFRDGRTGLAAGGRIRGDGPGARTARSDDGGATWRAAGEPRLKGAVYGLAWVPGAEAMAVAVGPGGIDVTTDGGRSWTAVDDGDTWSVAFAPSGVGWAVGPAGRIVLLRPQR